MRMAANTLMLTILILFVVPVFPPAQDEEWSEPDEEVLEIVELILHISAVDGYPESAVNELLIDEVISALRHDDYEVVISRWEEMVTASRGTLNPEQADEAMWYIIAGGFGESVRDLRYLADKVRFYIDAGESADGYLVELEKYRDEVGDGKITITTMDFNTNYSFGLESAGLSSIRSVDGAQIRAEIQRIEALKTRFTEQAGKAAMILEHGMRRRRSLINLIVTLKKEMEEITRRELETVEDGADAQE